MRSLSDDIVVLLSTKEPQSPYHFTAITSTPTFSPATVRTSATETYKLSLYRHAGPEARPAAFTTLRTAALGKKQRRSSRRRSRSADKIVAAHYREDFASAKPFYDQLAASLTNSHEVSLRHRMRVIFRARGSEA
jgi:hypothetical protein